MSYIHYEDWYQNFLVQIDELDMLSNNKQKNTVKCTLCDCLVNLTNADIRYDLGVIKPVIFSCRLDHVEGKEAFIISSDLIRVEDLILYLEPNRTSCPRYQAFIYKLRN